MKTIRSAMQPPLKLRAGRRSDHTTAGLFNPSRASSMADDSFTSVCSLESERRSVHKHASPLRSSETRPRPPLIVTTHPRTSASFVTVSATIRILLLLLRPDQLGAHTGTTPNIRHIVVGRCYDYITLVDPSQRVDCEEIWRRFEDAVLQESSCNVTAEDYHLMFHAVPQTQACDRFLFWSKTRTLMQSYAAVARQSWTLEDTLVGYMFNDLIWCGRKEESGFDFGSCPAWSACVNHPVYSLWRQASRNFAEVACGNITVLLNGSIANSFNRKSMFGSVELDSLNPDRVNHVNIQVVTNLDGPLIESCGQGSILDLIHILRSRGFRWTCTDNDRTLMMLQRIQNPEHSSCQTCAESSTHRNITST